MQQEDAQNLLNRYLEDKCSEEEKALLEGLYNRHEIKDLPEVPQSKKSIHSLWPCISIAAMLLVAFAGLYFYSSRDQASGQYVKTQINPGGNKAILTLSDGKRISLTEARNGEIAEQAGIKILKTADGQLIYSAVHSKRDNPSSFNTIETPKGGQCQVILPDGIEVKGS